MVSAIPLKVEGATPLREAEEPQSDPLLSCLEYAAEHFGLPFSAPAALASLPLKGPRLTPDLLPRAAAHAGLRARVRRQRIRKLPGIVLPVIALMKDGDACLVLKRAGRDRFAVVEPGRSREVLAVTRDWFDKRYSGYLIYMTPSDEGTATLLDRPQKVRPRHWFWSTIFRFWTSWIQIVIAAFIVNLLGLAVPLFTMNVYDRVIPNMALPTLWALAIGVGLALVFDATLRQLRSVVLDITGRRADLHISSILFEHALGLSMAGRTGSSGAIANQIREFDAVRDFFTSASIIAVTDLLFMGIFIFVLWHLIGTITLVPVVAVVVVLAATLLVQIPLGRSMRLTQQQASRRHSILVESLVGIESIKASGAEGVMQRKWEDAVAASARASSSARMWSSFATYFTVLVQQGVNVGIIIFGVFLVRDGELTIGGLIAASLLAARLLAPLGNIAMTLSRAQQAFTAMRGISDLMALPRDGAQGAMKSRVAGDGSLEFRNVVFAYEGQARPAVNDVSFRIEAGERVGIIGRIGSGKTTIGKLAAGFFTPSQGSLLVSNTDSRAFEPAELRATVGYVPQEPELFTGTIRDNIVLGRPHATPAEIERAVRTSGVDAFASLHPLGLHMPIGERGKGLSGGQRQAVALARMLLRDPRILFLDEPSSAMDSSTEAALVRELGKWAGPDRTLIVCTHRGLFLNLVDRLIVIEAGKIAADGRREEVLTLLNKPAPDAAKAGKQR